MNSEQFEIQNVTRRSLLNNYKIKSWQQVLARFKFKNACISSKAAVICFVWIFCIGILYRLTSYPGYFNFLPQWITALIYAGNAISLCFYPLAGYIADNVVGRYKVIINSLKIVIVTIIVGATLFIVICILAVVISSVVQNNIASLGIYLGIIPVCVICYFAINGSFIGFNANVIQFGMEQLHDSPAEHQSMFIYWYVWIYYLVQLVIVQPLNIRQVQPIISLCLFGILATSSFVTIIVSLCIAHRKKKWFLIIPARINPYKLVYKITRFARQHKVPIQRSAFTFCEDEIPTGLDLAKTKYGGPYTTEDVENVKAFYGILKILLCLCPVFLTTYAVDSSLYWYVEKFQTSSIPYHYILDNSTLSSLIVVILIPIHLFLFRQFKYCYSINMLRRLGVGILFLTLTLMTITAFNFPLVLVKKQCVLTPLNHNYVYTIIDSNYTYDTGTDGYSNYDVTDIDLKVPPSLLFLPRVLYGISNIFLYTALYEFICAQSPPSMKGLIIGLSFAIKGVFQAIAAFLLLVFIYVPTSHSICSVLYYGMNLLLAALTLIIYSYFAQKYKHRQRDEICNIYQYAEDYYSQTEEKHL